MSALRQEREATLASFAQARKAMSDIRSQMNKEVAARQSDTSTDVAASLERELGITSPPADADLLQAQMKREGDVMRARLQRAQQQRSEDVNSLKESLYTALATTRAQLAESRQQVRDLQSSLDNEILLRAEAERGRDKALRDQSSAQQEIERLRSAAQSVRQRPTSLDASSALSQLNQAILERDEALMRAAALQSEAKMLREKVDPLSEREKGVRSQIHALQEQRAEEMRGQLRDMEGDREVQKRVITDLKVRLENAQQAIRTMSADQGAATALNEEAIRERDQALRDVVAARKELAALRRAQVDGAAGASAARVQELEGALHESLVVSRQVAQSERELRDELDAAATHVQELQAALEREKSLQNNGLLDVTGMTGLPPGTTIRDLIERNARIEASAALTIHNLEHEVAAAEDRLSTSGLVAPLAVAKVPTTQQVAIVADHDSAKTLAVLYAKETELGAYKEATKNLQAFAKGLANRSPQRLAQQATEVIQEAASVLRASSTDQVDTLPGGWEARTTPKFGLTYYVDHNNKQSTWVHPSLSSPGMFMGAAPFSAAQPHLPGPRDPPLGLAQPLATAPTPTNRIQDELEGTSQPYHPRSAFKKLKNSRARAQQQPAGGTSVAGSSGPPGLNFASPIAVKPTAGRRPPR